jgi:hypothetical protein
MPTAQPDDLRRQADRAVIAIPRDVIEGNVDGHDKLRKRDPETSAISMPWSGRPVADGSGRRRTSKVQGGQGFSAERRKNGACVDAGDSMGTAHSMIRELARLLAPPAR